MSTTVERPLTADALAAELESVECASVLVVSVGERHTAERIVADDGLSLKVHSDPDRIPGRWELY